MNLKPTSDNVVIKPAAQIQQTESGLFVHMGVDFGHPLEGSVVAVGPRVADVKPGDHIIYNESPEKPARKLHHEREKYLVIRETQVAAVVEV